MTDAFDRLKKRSRPSVPPRNTSLIQPQTDSTTNNDTITETQNNSMTEMQNSTITKIQNDEMTEVSHSTFTTKEEVSQIEGDVIRRTLRIDEKIDYELEKICRQEKITREVFLEASFEICQANPAFLALVIQEATTRYQQRKKRGELRKLKTLTQKLEINQN